MRKQEREDETEFASYRWIEGINQDELGKLLGISPQLVSAIESGRRSPTCDIAPLGYGSSKIESAEMTEPLHRQRAATHVASTRRAKETPATRRRKRSLACSRSSPKRRKNKLEPLGPVHSGLRHHRVRFRSPRRGP